MKYVQMGPIAIDYFFYSTCVVDLLPTARACLSGTKLCPSTAAAEESGLKSLEIDRLKSKTSRMEPIIWLTAPHPPLELYL
jgi:hypothetical protein